MHVEIDDQNVYRLIGKMLALRGISSEMDLVERQFQGLSAQSVSRLQKALGLSDREVSSLIVSRRSLARRISTRQPLSLGEGDKVLRIARVFARARLVFAGDYASSWMREPKRQLSHRTPLEALKTEAGARAIEEQLLAIEHGVF